MRYEQWHMECPDPKAESRLRQAGYSSLLSAVLSARGVETPEQAAALLRRDQRLTISPMLMKDMEKAVTRIRQALSGRETIAIFGDYDVDGITATVVLVDYLQHLGAACRWYIPRRREDGYGLSRTAIQRLHSEGVTLLITVDCGITGNEAVDYASALGMDVVITDHHECPAELPRAVAVVDPHRPDDRYPFKYLAGVGVALKLVLALGNEEPALFHRYCTLAALGTIADVMQLRGENRIIVYNGLAALHHSDFVGLQALLEEAGLSERPVTALQIGFMLAPRLNAAGRMGAADLAADLLMCQDSDEAAQLARQLGEMNRERQEVEHAIASDAIAQIETLPPEERSALVLSSGKWHQGVVGIVASKLCEKYARPCFLIHMQNSVGRGSCRSWGNFNLFTALDCCSDLLEEFGGHAMAAGFTIRREHLAAFRTRINQLARAAGDGSPTSVLTIDAVISDCGQITLPEALSLEQLEPCGAGNPRPTLALLGVTVEHIQPVSQGRHLKLQFSKGVSRFSGIFFSMTEDRCAVHAGDRIDVAFYLNINNFRGQSMIQLQLLDLRPSRVPSRHEAEALQLIRRRQNGETLSVQDQTRFSRLTRRQITAVARELKKRGNPCTDAALPLLRALASVIGGGDRFFRAALALTILEQENQFQVHRKDEEITIAWDESNG